MTHAHQIGGPPTSLASSITELAERIRQLTNDAIVRGKRVPGRPTLATTLNTTGHFIRLALQHLREADRRTVPDLYQPGRGREGLRSGSPIWRRPQRSLGRPRQRGGTAS
ncbi:hypothetical protein [Alloactinosynnema sp. L-07]|nr:hypothetical protein [Alloactinosynnema sp. L-07]